MCASIRIRRQAESLDAEFPTMTLRTLLAASFLALFASTGAFAADSTDQGSAPVMVQVTSLDLAHAGPNQDDPHATFGIVNLKESACYAVSPPGSANIEVGERYALVPDADVDTDFRDKLRADYPKCAIVQVVAHMMPKEQVTP